MRDVLQRNLSTITERLLMITGEDEMHINRKNKKYWNGKLSTKLLIFANELLRFQDESGALAGRCLTFRMQQSFFGREDENLTEKLLAERPGILNLAMDALDELRERGKLLQSVSGVEMAERLGDLTSDVKVFVDECCDVGEKFQVRVSEIFVCWQDWCAAHNTRHGWGSNQFSEKLRSVLPTLTSGRPRKDRLDITAHEYLKSLYQDPNQPPSLRLRAAVKAIEVETPRISATSECAVRRCDLCRRT
jgi:phage/plasmid-associated DNA primase